LNRTAARLGTVTLAALAALACTLAVAAPAFAHTEIELDNPQAGATNVTMNVTAEAENDGAGIVSVRLVLPDGIAPTDASLVSGPAGWTLTQGTDGVTVAGAALKIGTDAKFTVRLAQLPATASVLVFKSLVTYQDGKVDRWIEVPGPSNLKPDHPAPVVSLRPAPVVATSAPPTTGAPSPTPSAPTSVAPRAAANKGGTGLGWLIAVLVVLVAAAAVGYVVVRRRRAGSAPS